MANLRVNYKKKPAGFGNVEERRIIRAVEEIQYRKNRRSAIYASQRKIVESNTPGSVSDQVEPDAQGSKTEDRRTKLLKWKAEKELQKQLAKQKKLPPFRAGVIHHKLNSPKFLCQDYPPIKPKVVTPRITRATAKRIAAKKNSTVIEKIDPIRPNEAVKSIKISETSFAPTNHQFKAPEGLPVLPLFGPEALNVTKTESGTMPVYFSPYVVSARGKRASRKEQQQNIEIRENSLTETRTDENSGQSEGSPGHEEQLTTSHFRRITEKEVARLRALCQHWMQIKTDDNVPDDAQLVINQAIGQTNLLINKKMEQFKQLIVDCESGSSDQLVTCQDLQGFWEMMYMQVENCDLRFNKLARLQERNWVEEEPTVVKKVRAVKKPVASKKVIPSTSSSVREMIRAARRKQMESQTNLPENSPAKTNRGTPGESGRLSAVKFDGGFFMVESPKKTVTPRSIRKSSLSQPPVHSDEAKRRRSALNLIRLSQILKPPEIKPVTVETDPTILYVNSQQTPCKSILKRIDAHEAASGVKKSQNKVIFCQNQKTPEHNMSWIGESQNLMSDAQERDAEPQAEFKIKKLLDLSDSDSDVEGAKDQLNQKSKTSCNQQVHLSVTKVSNNHLKVDDETSLSSEMNETQQDEPSALAPLRESSVNSMRTTRGTRQGTLNECSEEMVSEFSNIRVNELDTCHTKEDFTETNGHHKENTKPHSPEIMKRRRSLRKSVKFTGEECTACTDVKPVHPMTPRVKRRSSKSGQNLDKSSSENTKVKTPSTQASQDLISWDTPKDIPSRVRRSLRLQGMKLQYNDETHN